MLDPPLRRAGPLPPRVAGESDSAGFGQQRKTPVSRSLGEESDSPAGRAGRGLGPMAYRDSNRLISFTSRVNRQGSGANYIVRPPHNIQRPAGGLTDTARGPE